MFTRFTNECQLVLGLLSTMIEIMILFAMIKNYLMILPPGSMGILCSQFIIIMMSLSSVKLVLIMMTLYMPLYGMIKPILRKSIVKSKVYA